MNCDVVVSEEQYDRVVNLLRRLMKDSSPLAMDEIACAYCGENIWHSTGNGHLPDCPWVEARNFLASLES